MPKVSDKERVSAWDKRVTRSTRNDYEPWEQEFDCDMLEEYYAGKQWKEQSAEWSQRKYVINLFYPSINISKPSLLFHIPKYRVTANPARLDDPLSDVQVRAKLQEDTLQTEVNRKRLGFAVETGLAIHDAQFRFGVVRIGYTASDYIDNPNAGKPILIDGQEQIASDGSTVVQPNISVPKREELFMQWIPAKNFRVAEGAGNRLSTADWCGYFKWLNIQDVKRNPNYRNTSGLKATGQIKGTDSDKAQNTVEDQVHEGMIKVWFIWDQRSKTRLVYQQGGEKFFLEEPFKFLPFAALKFDERLGKWLPLPPTYNWVHPQNELNDTREMQRIHRKRAKRRFRRRPSVKVEEFQKLEDGEDFVCIETQNEDDITAIPDAPLDPQIMANLPVSHEDFTRISGISGESQQVAQSETATQANLIAVMGQTRESAKRLVVAEWLSEIGRIILLTLRSKMALNFWVKVAVDPASPLKSVEEQEIKKIWKQIKNEDLGDIENDISVDITSLSPIAREQERTNWMTFLGVVTSPTIGLVLSKSPTLLRKTAGLFDIRSEAELREVSNAMEAVAVMFAQAQADKAGVQMPQGPAPGPTPTNGGIQDQLMAQMPAERLQ